MQLCFFSSSPQLTQSFIFFLESLFSIYKHNVLVSAYGQIEKYLKEGLNRIKGELTEEHKEFNKHSQFLNLGRQLIIIQKMCLNPQFISVAIFKDLPKILLSIVYQLEMEMGNCQINE